MDCNWSEYTLDKKQWNTIKDLVLNNSIDVYIR